MTDTAVFLFHREFRLYDNTGLNAIARSGKKIIPVFIFDPVQIDPKRNKYFSNGSVQFMCESLEELDKDIRKLGSKMIFMHGDTVKTLDKLHKKFKFQNLVSHEDNTPFADKRDADVRKWAESKGVEFVHLQDYDMYDYREGLKDNRPYGVFTAYYRYCLKNLTVRPIDIFKLTKSHFVTTSKLSVKGAMDAKQIQKYYKYSDHLFFNGGRKFGEERLNNLKNMKNYDETRNDPNLRDGTTHLSAYLKYGCVSIREAFWRLNKLFGINHGLIRELIWRSFYAKIAKFTKVLDGKAFRPSYDNVKWSWNRLDFKKFARAETGVPIVDASLHALYYEGFMHNRLRMVVAMFMTKDLLLHWSLGERLVFATNLVDYDPASNNGGWEWSSSSGADGSQFLRIFNPYRQAEKFDPNAEFIKKWLPELKEVPAKDIHNWENAWKKWKGVYRRPMVIHKQAVEKAKQTFIHGLYKKK